MDLPPNLEILRSARSISFGPHGFIQTLPSEARAYLKALEERNFSAEQLAWLLKIGASGGRVYAACLLRALDSEAGIEVLTALLDDDEEVLFLAAGSCSVIPTTVAECARWLLTRAPEKRAPEAVYSARYDSERQAQLQARMQDERLRLERIRQLNQRTAELTKANDGQSLCPHCHTRAAHRIVGDRAADREVYLICSICHRSFNARNEPEAEFPEQS